MKFRRFWEFLSGLGVMRKFRMFWEVLRSWGFWEVFQQLKMLGGLEGFRVMRKFGRFGGGSWVFHEV